MLAVLLIAFAVLLIDSGGGAVFGEADQDLVVDGRSGEVSRSSTLGIPRARFAPMVVGHGAILAGCER